MKKLFSLLCVLLAWQFVIAQEDCDDISGEISPSNSTICSGGSVELTATGGSSYEWRLNDVVIDGQTGSTLTATEPGTYSVIIKEGECSVPASNTATVTVNPTPTGTISPANASFCAGGSTTLTATGGDSYTWFRNGVEIDGEDDETLTVTQAGTYSVTIHQDDCSGTASNTSTVTIASAPTGTISPANASFCAGGSTTLTATGGDSYTWFRNGVRINGQDDATLTVTQAGTYSVTIHQDDCSGPASNTSSVTIAPAPTGTISPANASFCAGGSTTLTATGGDSYTWFRNGVQINGQDDATLTVTQAGTYSVTIHQDDCSGSASNTSTVTIASAPSGTISPANASFCAGGSTTLTASGGDSYTWFRNGVQINGHDDATLTVTQAGTYSVTIHQDDCSGPASNTSTVTLASAPTGTITPANASICQGGSATLTASGGTSYTWFLNGEEIKGEDEETLDADEPGEYTVTIHNGNCSGPASNSSVVVITSAPTGNITPATASICEGGSTVLTASGGTSYTWFRNGNEIEDQTGATLTVTRAGTYSAIVRQGECNGEAANTAVVTTVDAPSGTISPSVASICQGGSTTLTATGGTSYTWLRNGNVINGEDDATLNITQAGTYTAIIHNGDCSAEADNSAVITLLPLPIGTISPATGSICNDGSLTLTATGGSSYVWFRNGTQINGETGATLDVTQPGTYTAIINQATCSAPALNGAVITQSSTPTGSITPASGTICANGSIVLKVSGGNSYTWYRNGNVINGQTGSSLTVTQEGTYSATIRQGNCTAPASNEVEINEADAPSGSILPAISSICEGGSVLLTASGGTTYTWRRNGDVIAGQTGATLNVTEPGSYSATIHQGNCSGPASNIAVVSATSTPTGTISPATAVICAGGSQVLTATGGTSYVWLKDDEIISGQQSATLTVTEAGTYSVIIQNGSCQGPASNTATITVENTPGIRYPDVNASPGTPVLLEARDIGITFEWIPGTEMNNPAARVPTLTTSTDGEYRVNITTENGCVITDTVFVRVKTVIFVPTGFTPDKNGTNDALRPLGSIRSIDYFRVFNRWGQMVYETRQLGTGWDGVFKGTDQPADTYTWVLVGVASDGKPIKLSGKSRLIR